MGKLILDRLNRLAKRRRREAGGLELSMHLRGKEGREGAVYAVGIGLEVHALHNKPYKDFWTVSRNRRIPPFCLP